MWQQAAAGVANDPTPASAGLWDVRLPALGCPLLGYGDSPAHFREWGPARDLAVVFSAHVK